MMRKRYFSYSRDNMFQSLFSWNLFLMFGTIVFWLIDNQFQSLFSWNLFLMYIDAYPRTIPFMFQSLFSWNLFLMTKERKLLGLSEMFQSLFSWNLFLMLSLHNLYQYIETKFQSLFSWNLFLMLRYNKLLTISLSSFNPCFRGTCSWWRTFMSEIGDQIRVSILVFVELVLDETVNKFFNTRMNLFQSLFSWNLFLMSEIRGLSRHGRRRFNPCFRGTCSWCLRMSLHISF